jgi:hypothetical protein
MSNMQDKHGGNNDQSDEKQPSNETKAWSGFQRDSQQCHSMRDDKELSSINLKDVIIMDTGSTIRATFMNPKLLSDIKAANRPLTMITNAGEKNMILTGKINGFGDAWYDPDQVANIFGFSSLEDQCRITYVSNVEKAFNVHTTDGIVQFKRNVDGLYVYQPFKAYLDEVANGNQVTGPKIETNLIVQTVTESKKGYRIPTSPLKIKFHLTIWQLPPATIQRTARKLYHILGCPTVENLRLY